MKCFGMRLDVHHQEIVVPGWTDHNIFHTQAMIAPSVLSACTMGNAPLRCGLGTYTRLAYTIIQLYIKLITYNNNYDNTFVITIIVIIMYH